MQNQGEFVLKVYTPFPLDLGHRMTPTTKGRSRRGKLPIKGKGRGEYFEMALGYLFSDLLVHQSDL